MAKSRTTKTLRNTLFDEMDSLIGGGSTEDRAHAVARLSNAIIASSRLELDHCSLKDGTPGEIAL